MNTKSLGITIIDVRSEDVPTGLKIGFDSDRAVNKKTVEGILRYWVTCPAISQSDYSITWTGYHTLILQTDFSTGYFCGDLTHRDAVMFGDKKFNIGLTKLFTFGNTPQTDKGKSFDGCEAPPIFIECLYEENAVMITDGLRETVRTEVDLRIKNLLQYLSSQVQV